MNACRARGEAFAADPTWEIAELVRDYPEVADRIVLIEDTTQPYLEAIEGLWGRTIKGMRGATPRPGSMAAFIRACRRDPATLHRYLAMTPEEEVYIGNDIGQVPKFRKVPESRHYLPLAPEAHRRTTRAA